jgi:hypothetical protein
MGIEAPHWIGSILMKVVEKRDTAKVSDERFCCKNLSMFGMTVRTASKVYGYH